MINSTPSPWVPKLEVSKDACISSPLLQAPPLVSLETSLSQGSKVQFTCIISSWSKIKKQRVPWCQLSTVRAIVICLMIWCDLNNGLNWCLLLQIHRVALFLLGGQDEKLWHVQIDKRPSYLNLTIVGHLPYSLKLKLFLQMDGIFSWSFWGRNSPTRASFGHVFLQSHHLSPRLAICRFCDFTSLSHQLSVLCRSTRK